MIKMAISRLYQYIRKRSRKLRHSKPYIKSWESTKEDEEWY